MKGPYSPSRDRVSQHPLYPPDVGSSDRFCPCSQGKAPMLVPGVLNDLGQHQELRLKLVLFSHGWVRKRMCLTLSLGALQQCHFWVPQAPLGPGWAQDFSPLATTLSSPRRCNFSTRFQLKMLFLGGSPP